MCFLMCLGVSGLKEGEKGLNVEERPNKEGKIWLREKYYFVIVFSFIVNFFAKSMSSFLSVRKK